MKKLRQRLLALTPRDKDEVLPAAFYLKHGFSAADANDIMAQWADLGLEDEEGEIAETALIHAWSILALLGGKEGRGFLIEELGVACSLGDDLFLEAFADLMFAAGPEAVPELIANLGDGREGEDVLVEIASALTGFARHDIERDAILDAQADALRGDPRHRWLKGTIIADLIELSSDTYLPQIRKAFEENLVDVSVTGDLEAVEIELGLRSERSGPKPHWSKMEAKLARESLERRLGPRPAKGDDAGIIRYYLERHRGPRSFRNLVEFDGLILGTILAPTFVRPSRYLSAIWDPENHEHDPEWDSQEDAQLFFTAVMNWHNGIIRRLDEGTYSPPFEPRSEPRVPTEDEICWTRGLIGSVMLWESGSADSSEIHQALIAAAMHLVNPSDDTPDAELIQVAHVVRGAHMIREALMGGGDRPSSSGDFEGLGGDPGAEIETYRREAPRIGRNDPCPCGSGLKYKRCCMN